MYGCSKFTDIGFNALLTTALKNLTELCFKNYNNLKNSNVIKMSEHFSNLQVFSISFNDIITDESIIAITKNCKNLIKLCIDCENLTNISFESIANHCLKLKYLTISANKNNNNETCLTKIIKNCVKLKELQINSIHNIPYKDFIENLKKQNLFLKIL
jgi:hypothetical protein